MNINLFDISNKTVIINHNCLSIPELKAIVDYYKDPIPAFNFLHYKFDPHSVYANIPEIEKDDILLKDFAGEYTLEDDVMINAINKILMEKMGVFVRTAPITSGRDGNVAAMQAQLKSVGKTILEFKQLEKVALLEADEARGRIRGGKKLAYDQKS